MYVINCKKSITLRTAPSTSASAIRQIPLGSAVSYIEGAENGFYKIVYLSDTGYALASYLGDEPTEGIRIEQKWEGTYAHYQTLYVVNCRKSITLRTSPSTSASEIRQIPLGESVTYLEDAANGFYKIVYLGDTGYALASYLDVYFDPFELTPSDYIYNAYQTLYVINCKKSITLRTSPSTSADGILQIPLGASVTFLEFAENGFFKIAYNGQTGYALASYLGL